MDYTLIYSVTTISVMGLILGLGLSFAAKKLAVAKDALEETIEKVLPGINCGACGYTGCAGYARALASKEDSDTGKCAPGGADVAQKLGELLGKPAAAAVKKLKRVAQVACRGGKETSVLAENFAKQATCAEQAKAGGEKACAYSCLSLGDCIQACPTQAIGRRGELVVVNVDKCISCGKCVRACPRNVIKMVNFELDYFVACNNTDAAKATRDVCKVGCIGCRVCDKTDHEGGFIIENNLCFIESEAPRSNRAEAAEKCPAHCIVPQKSV